MIIKTTFKANEHGAGRIICTVKGHRFSIPYSYEARDARKYAAIVAYRKITGKEPTTVIELPNRKWKLE